MSILADVDGFDAVVAAMDNEPLPHYPESFWDATPVLASLRDYARGEMVSPASLLGVALSEVIARTPPEVVLPHTVGRQGSLNLLVCLVGASGSGKSLSLSSGRDFINHDDPFLRRQNVGSGEGIIATFVEARKDSDEVDGKKVSVTKYEQVAERAFVTVDEVGTLTAVGSRQGATLMPTIRSAITGGMLGTKNRSADTSGHVDGGSYRLVMVIGVQPTMAGALYGDTGSGTAQRALWFPTTDPNADDEASFSPRLNWQPPKMPPLGVNGKREMEVHPDVVAYIRRDRAAALRGEAGNEGREHHNLLRMKVAAALALLHSDTRITMEWWEMANDIVRVSDYQRDAIGEAMQREERERATRRGLAQQYADDARAEVTLERAVRVAERFVKRNPDGVTRKQFRSHLGRYKGLYGEVLEAGIRRGLFVQQDTLHPDGSDKASALILPGEVG